jgi:uncharacterized protein
VSSLDPAFLVLAPMVALLAYVAYGLTGFGSTVIAVPLLAQLVPLKFAVPLMLLLDVGFGLWTGWRYRRQAQYREIGILLPFILIGMVVGVTLLVSVPERILLGALGVFVLGYAIYCLSRPRTAGRIARGWAVPLGLAGGTFSAMFGTGGVLYIVYLAGRIHDKSELRASVATLVLLSAAPRLLLFGFTGLLTQNGMLTAWALLLPVGVVGLWLGNRLHHALPGASVLRLVYGVLLLSGVALIVRVAAY